MNNKFLKFIGMYEIAGGILGVILTFASALGVFGTNSSRGIASILVAVILFSASVLAGKALFKGNKSGMLLSVVVQTFQIFQFYIGKVRFEFTAGFKVSHNRYCYYETAFRWQWL